MGFFGSNLTRKNDKEDLNPTLRRINANTRSPLAQGHSVPSDSSSDSSGDREIFPHRHDAPCVEASEEDGLERRLVRVAVGLESLHFAEAQKVADVVSELEIEVGGIRRSVPVELNLRDTQDVELQRVLWVEKENPLQQDKILIVLHGRRKVHFACDLAGLRSGKREVLLAGRRCENVRAQVYVEADWEVTGGWMAGDNTTTAGRSSRGRDRYVSNNQRAGGNINKSRKSRSRSSSSSSSSSSSGPMGRGTGLSRHRGLLETSPQSARRESNGPLKEDRMGARNATDHRQLVRVSVGLESIHFDSEGRGVTPAPPEDDSILDFELAVGREERRSQELYSRDLELDRVFWVENKDPIEERDEIKIGVYLAEYTLYFSCPLSGLQSGKQEVILYSPYVPIHANGSETWRQYRARAQVYIEADYEAIRPRTVNNDMGRSVISSTPSTHHKKNKSHRRSSSSRSGSRSSRSRSGSSRSRSSRSRSRSSRSRSSRSRSRSGSRSRSSSSGPMGREIKRKETLKRTHHGKKKRSKSKEGSPSPHSRGAPRTSSLERTRVSVLVFPIETPEDVYDWRMKAIVEGDELYNDMRSGSEPFWIDMEDSRNNLKLAAQCLIMGKIPEDDYFETVAEVAFAPSQLRGREYEEVVLDCRDKWQGLWFKVGVELHYQNDSVQPGRPKKEQVEVHKHSESVGNDGETAQIEEKVEEPKEEVQEPEKPFVPAIDALTNAGDSALHLAVANDHRRCAEVLLRYGAQFSIANSFTGKKPLDDVASAKRKVSGLGEKDTGPYPLTTREHELARLWGAAYSNVFVPGVSVLARNKVQLPQPKIPADISSLEIPPVSEVAKWDVDQVALCLNFFGFGMFEDAFRKSRVDGGAAMALTHSVLCDELGVESYGQRQLIMKLFHAEDYTWGDSLPEDCEPVRRRGCRSDVVHKRIPQKEHPKRLPRKRERIGLDNFMKFEEEWNCIFRPILNVENFKGAPFLERLKEYDAKKKSNMNELLHRHGILKRKKDKRTQLQERESLFEPFLEGTTALDVKLPPFVDDSKIARVLHFGITNAFLKVQMDLGDDEEEEELFVNKKFAVGVKSVKFSRKIEGAEFKYIKFTGKIGDGDVDESDARAYANNVDLGDIFWIGSDTPCEGEMLRIEIQCEGEVWCSLEKPVEQWEKGKQEVKLYSSSGPILQATVQVYVKITEGVFRRITPLEAFQNAVLAKPKEDDEKESKEATEGWEVLEIIFGSDVKRFQEIGFTSRGINPYLKKKLRKALDSRKKQFNVYLCLKEHALFTLLHDMASQGPDQVQTIWGEPTKVLTKIMAEISDRDRNDIALSKVPDRITSAIYVLWGYQSRQRDKIVTKKSSDHMEKCLGYNPFQQNLDHLMGENAEFASITELRAVCRLLLNGDLEEVQKGLMILSYQTTDLQWLRRYLDHHESIPEATVREDVGKEMLFLLNDDENRKLLLSSISRCGSLPLDHECQSYYLLCLHRLVALGNEQLTRDIYKSSRLSSKFGKRISQALAKGEHELASIYMKLLQSYASSPVYAKELLLKTKVLDLIVKFLERVYSSLLFGEGVVGFVHSCLGVVDELVHSSQAMRALTLSRPELVHLLHVLFDNIGEVDVFEQLLSFSLELLDPEYEFDEGCANVANAIIHELPSMEEFLNPSPRIVSRIMVLKWRCALCLSKVDRDAVMSEVFKFANAATPLDEGFSRGDVWIVVAEILQTSGSDMDVATRISVEIVKGNWPLSLKNSLTNTNDDRGTELPSALLAISKLFNRQAVAISKVKGGVDALESIFHKLGGTLVLLSQPRSGVSLPDAIRDDESRDRQRCWLSLRAVEDILEHFGDELFLDALGFGLLPMIEMHISHGESARNMFTASSILWCCCRQDVKEMASRGIIPTLMKALDKSVESVDFFQAREKLLVTIMLLSVSHPQSLIASSYTKTLVHICNSLDLSRWDHLKSMQKLRSTSLSLSASLAYKIIGVLIHSSNTPEPSLIGIDVKSLSETVVAESCKTLQNMQFRLSVTYNLLTFLVAAAYTTTGYQIIKTAISDSPFVRAVNRWTRSIEASSSFEYLAKVSLLIQVNPESGLYYPARSLMKHVRDATSASKRENLVETTLHSFASLLDEAEYEEDIFHVLTDSKGGFRNLVAIGMPLTRSSPQSLGKLASHCITILCKLMKSSVRKLTKNELKAIADPIADIKEIGSASNVNPAVSAAAKAFLRTLYSDQTDELVAGSKALSRSTPEMEAADKVLPETRNEPSDDGVEEYVPASEVVRANDTVIVYYDADTEIAKEAHKMVLDSLRVARDYRVVMLPSSSVGQASDNVILSNAKCVLLVLSKNFVKNRKCVDTASLVLELGRTVLGLWFDHEKIPEEENRLNIEIQSKGFSLNTFAIPKEQKLFIRDLLEHSYPTITLKSLPQLPNLRVVVTDQAGKRDDDKLLTDKRTSKTDRVSRSHKSESVNPFSQIKQKDAGDGEKVNPFTPTGRPALGRDPRSALLQRVLTGKSTSQFSPQSTSSDLSASSSNSVLIRNFGTGSFRDSFVIDSPKGHIAEAKPLKKWDVFISHNWGNDSVGRDNHGRVVGLTRALQMQGLKVWSDEDEMMGDLKQAMTQGIDNSQSFIVVVTAKYMEKIATKIPRTDNCCFEYSYGLRRCPVVVPVVMEPGLHDTRRWFGPLGADLGGELYVDVSESGSESSGEKAREIVRIIHDLTASL